MARALTADELEQYGVDCVHVDDDVDTRRTSSSPFTPLAFMVHHTAGTDSLDLIVRNVLANYHLAKDGTLTLVATGRTAHPGMGSPKVLEDLRDNRAPAGDASRYSPTPADPTRHLDPTADSRIPGYQWFVGVEVENLGDGEDPYTEIQLDVMGRLAAAHCIHWGWPPERVIHHREWTSRKIDMSWRGPLRWVVAMHMLAHADRTTQENPPMPLHPDAAAAELLGFWTDKINGRSTADDPATREHAAIMAKRGSDHAIAEAKKLVDGIKIPAPGAKDETARTAIDRLSDAVDELTRRLDDLDTPTRPDGEGSTLTVTDAAGDSVDLVGPITIS
jgi:hypothetical protein